MSQDASLKNMAQINFMIMKMDEQQCLDLLLSEKKGRKRRCVLLRIHSRVNYLRAHREREELKKISR